MIVNKGKKGEHFTLRSHSYHMKQTGTRKIKKKKKRQKLRWL